ncbi:tRNA lysidine(34) synthetase TilS [bacterium]|nr:tRNA lysidine(34) synthetase TilS [bacterium]RQV98659.1 MAG: tRNA lysidine(34) synthetase TilS [bacterium]
MDFFNKFHHYVDENNLIVRQDKVLIAVSGGIDSIVLLDLFLQIRSELNLVLSGVHVNHGLRGKQADRDEIFVRNSIRNIGLPFYSLKMDVKGYSKRKKLSVEEGGRKLRFDFFNTLLKRLSYDKIALAHHAHDQAETIIMNLARGSGIRGMGGMHPQRNKIIHPLLFASKEEIVSYAHHRNLCHVEDHTNRDKTILRNRIRWDIVRSMEESIGSYIIHSISHTGKVMREVQAFIDFESQKALKKVIEHRSQNEIILDIVKFLKYFKIVQKNMLIQILNEIDYPNRYVRSLEIETILRLIEKGRKGSVYCLKNDLMAIKQNNWISFTKMGPPVKEIKVKVGQEYDIPDLGMRFHAECIKKEMEMGMFTNNRWIEYLDYDTLTMPLKIRSWNHGDWFIPLGMSGRKKLHDFFIDAKVPKYKRASVPLLIGGENIVWIIGYRIDDQFKVTDQTTRILKVMMTQI